MGRACCWVLSEIAKRSGEPMATLVNQDVQKRPLEVGVFDSVDDARRAVQGLLSAGFTREHITVVCSDETKERNFREFEHQEPAGTFTPSATIAGATIGALLGGLTVV